MSPDSSVGEALSHPRLIPPGGGNLFKVQPSIITFRQEKDVKLQVVSRSLKLSLNCQLYGAVINNNSKGEFDICSYICLKHEIK